MVKKPSICWTDYQDTTKLIQTLQRIETKPKKEPDTLFHTITIIFCVLLTGIMIGYSWRIHHENKATSEIRSHIEHPDIATDLTNIPTYYLGQTSYTTIAGE